ncbi:MAG: hypothetical protein RIQ60_618 [Pseudomonadota bacterium]|jgi:hypothetical protein
MAAPDSFLSRWSRRKAEARQAELAPPVTPTAASPVEPAVAPPAATAAMPAPTQVVDGALCPAASDAATAPVASPTGAPDELPTLADVEQLGHESDYTRFVAPDVNPEVKNAALKKLFSDPHFTVMDGLDTYIEDYGIPNPIEPAMLRQMAQTNFLGLFTDEARLDEAATGSAAAPADVDAVAGPVAGCATASSIAPTAALPAAAAVEAAAALPHLPNAALNVPWPAGADGAEVGQAVDGSGARPTHTASAAPGAPASHP